MDISGLVEAARLQTGCWVTRLEGVSAEFMAAIDAGMADGEKFSAMAVKETLRNLDPEFAQVDVRHHLGKACSCWK